MLRAYLLGHDRVRVVGHGAVDLCVEGTRRVVKKGRRCLIHVLTCACLRIWVGCVSLLCFALLCMVCCMVCFPFGLITLIVHSAAFCSRRCHVGSVLQLRRIAFAPLVHTSLYRCCMHAFVITYMHTYSYMLHQIHSSHVTHFYVRARALGHQPQAHTLVASE